MLDVAVNNAGAIIMALAVGAAVWIWQRGQGGGSRNATYIRIKRSKGNKDGAFIQAVLAGFLGDPGSSQGQGGSSSPGQPAPTQISFNPGLATGSRYSAILAVIGQAEAPRGYDQYYSGIAAQDAPPRQLTQMTVNEVLAWQNRIDPKYNSEAAGRYQVMEDTLRGLVQGGQISGNARFDGNTQDAIAIALMGQQGLASWQSGQMSDADFADRLARVWAGLPVQKSQRGAKRTVSRGQSYYAAVGNNAATVSPDAVLSAVQSARYG